MKAMADLQSLQNQHSTTLKRCEEAVKKADFYQWVEKPTTGPFVNFLTACAVHLHSACRVLAGIQFLLWHIHSRLQRTDFVFVRVIGMNPLYQSKSWWVKPWKNPGSPSSIYFYLFIYIFIFKYVFYCLLSSINPESPFQTEGWEQGLNYFSISNALEEFMPKRWLCNHHQLNPVCMARHLCHEDNASNGAFVSLWNKLRRVDVKGGGRGICVIHWCHTVSKV